MNDNPNIYYINFSDTSFIKIQKLATSTHKIPGEKVFSRICAIKTNPYGDDISKFLSDYQNKFNKIPNVNFEAYGQFDPNSHYYSGQIAYKLLQTGAKLGSYFSNPKHNTYCLCPFCELKFKSHKEHKVEIETSNGQRQIVDSNVEGFYDTGKSAFCHHLADCHGVLKKSLMPQPYIGFSKSLHNNGTYELSLVCPHQHWDEATGQFQGCNVILPYNIGKNMDVDVPFKAYFRHFYKYHVSEPKDENLLNAKEVEAQRSAILKKMEDVAKEPKHIQTPDNVFIPISLFAHQETIQYQQKNSKDGFWNPTLETVHSNQIEMVERWCVSNNFAYYPPGPKDEPMISHDAVFRSRDTTPRSSSASSRRSSFSQQPVEQPVKEPLNHTTVNTGRVEKPKKKQLSSVSLNDTEYMQQLFYRQHGSFLALPIGLPGQEHVQEPEPTNNDLNQFDSVGLNNYFEKLLDQSKDLFKSSVQQPNEAVPIDDSDLEVNDVNIEEFGTPLRKQKYIPESNSAPNVEINDQDFEADFKLLKETDQLLNEPHSVNEAPVDESLERTNNDSENSNSDELECLFDEELYEQQNKKKHEAEENDGPIVPTNAANDSSKEIDDDIFGEIDEALEEIGHIPDSGAVKTSQCYNNVNEDSSSEVENFFNGLNDFQVLNDSNDVMNYDADADVDFTELFEE